MGRSRGPGQAAPCRPCQDDSLHSQWGGGGAPEVDATRPVLARAPPGGRVQNTLSGARVKPRRVERHSNSLSPEKGHEKWSILDLFGR